jgi:hypothetical protein
MADDTDVTSLFDDIQREQENSGIQVFETFTVSQVVTSIRLYRLWKESETDQPYGTWLQEGGVNIR